MRVRVFNIILCQKITGTTPFDSMYNKHQAIRLQMTVPIFMDGSADSPVKTEESKPVPLISSFFSILGLCDM